MPVKTNRKTWIYGVGSRSKKPPRYPPVVPWITPALRDNLIELIMERIKPEDGLGRVEADIAQLESLPTLSTVQRRRLMLLRREHDTLKARTPKGLLARVTGDVANFSLLRGVRAVRIEPHHNTDQNNHRLPAVEHIVLETCPITINGARLGTYDVFLDPRYELPRAAFDLVRRDYAYESGVHPHWSTGGPCFGTFGPMLQQVLKKHDVAAALGMFMRYLATYNGGSPLIGLYSFKTGGFYENHHPLA